MSRESSKNPSAKPAAYAGSESLEKATASKILGSVFRLMGPERRWTWPALTLLFIAAVLELFPGFAWKYVTDEILLRQPGRSTRWLREMMSLDGTLHSAEALLVSAVTWLFVLNALAEASSSLGLNLLYRTAQAFTNSLRVRVYTQLQRQSLGYLHRHKIGELMARCIGDVDELQSLLVNGGDTVAGDGTAWVAAASVAVALDWHVAIIALFPMVITYFSMRHYNARVKRLYASNRQCAGELSSRLSENLNGIVVIKAFGREEYEADRFAKVSQRQYQAQVAIANARSVYFPFNHILTSISNVAILGGGSYIILRHPLGSFTVGSLILYRMLLSRLFSPLLGLSRLNDIAQRSAAAGRRILMTLNAPLDVEECSNARAQTHQKGAIALKNINFTYPTAEDGRRLPALRDVSLSAEPGTTVAICGPSGAGKSTILNLLLRFYDPDAGHVFLDGNDVRTLSNRYLRQRIAIVQQETTLFSDSILDNIRYGNPEANLAEVIDVARAANAHEFISGFPKGYETLVGERGVRLSGGQKQRIAVARAFLMNPEVLLLDEPTSSVEPESEAIIVSALIKLMNSRTTILTSHRPALIARADKVCLVNDGRVIAIGSPSSLITSNAWFARFMSKDGLAGPAAAN